MRASLGCALFMVILLHPTVSALESPFLPPVGGWPADAPVGTKNSIRVSGLDDWSRAWYNLGVPDGKNNTPRYTPQQAWPLVIVLHGSGGTANNLTGVFRRSLMDRGAIVVFATSLQNTQLLDWHYPHEHAYLLHIIADIYQQYRIDPKRISITGHSMGGGGAYAMADSLEGLWAASAPIAGWYLTTPRPSASRMARNPMYLLHGTNDANVPIAYGSDPAASAVEKAGGTVVFDRVEGGTHSSVLDKPSIPSPNVLNLENWLVQQERSAQPLVNELEDGLSDYAQRFSSDWVNEGPPMGYYQPEASDQHLPPVFDTAPSLSQDVPPLVMNRLTFSCAASDPNKDPVAVRWQWNDGSHSTWGEQVTHQFAEAGEYTVSCTAYDAIGLRVTQTLTVRISARASTARRIALDVPGISLQAQVDNGETRSCPAIFVFPSHTQDRQFRFQPLGVNQ